MNDVQSYLVRRALADLDNNGAILLRQPDTGDGLDRALVDFRPGADRERCRAIVAQAKANGVWPALVRSLPITEAAR